MPVRSRPDRPVGRTESLSIISYSELRESLAALPAFKDLERWQAWRRTIGQNRKAKARRRTSLLVSTRKNPPRGIAWWGRPPVPAPLQAVIGSEVTQLDSI